MSKAQNPKTKCPSFGDFKRIPWIDINFGSVNKKETFCC
jgi:hypothetical protein